MSQTGTAPLPRQEATPVQQPARNCPQCSGTAVSRPFPAEHPWFSRCGDCGLGFADPQPSDDDLSAIYDEHYYEQFGFLEARGGQHKGLSLIKQATYGLMLRKAEKFITPKGARGRLLDVGCGLGFSLEAAGRHGWEPLGLDPLGPRASARETLHHHPIIKGTLEAYRPDEPFDFISMIDMIEHVRDPVATFELAAELLRPGGILMVATNNIEGRQARRLGPRWVHLIRAHLWFFSPKTIARAAEQAGLQVRTVELAWRVYNLEYVCEILARGTNFELAKTVSRWILRWVPRPIRVIPWPPLPEGMVLVASKPA